MTVPAWVVAPLDGKSHQRATFSCPDAPELERYLKQQASQDIKRNVARVLVATEPQQTAVVGFYSLNAASFQKESLRPADAKKLPQYPVPAALIGRLAVDMACRKSGLGEYLLMNALERIHGASQVLAVHAVIVDARDAKAERFYKRYGFQSFPDTPHRLFLPMDTVQRLISA
ncbi:MAG: GNAT family N-acetyltransferase [Rhodospirillaceae bacterium]|nr:GNAT family N-acetyltransferase [Rhodospirillaceae bacterium]